MINRDSGADFAILSLPANPMRRPTDPPLSSEVRNLSGELQACVRQIVGSELEAVEILIQQAVHSRFAEVELLSRRAAAMGGKRLRPVLLLLSARACARSPLTALQARDLTAAAASVELVHAASLVHDDVMDQAVERRHQPTIVEQSGNSAAVLLGDFLFTRAYAMAAACNSTYPARQIAAAATNLCEGELRQQASAGNWELSWKEYKSILDQKTASLCRVSCRLGAWRVGGGRDQRQALANFGRLLGLAFQIYDDWLDYWGSDQTVGKTLGTDLAQHKPTLPLLRLLQTSDATARRGLISQLTAGGDSVRSDIRRQLEHSDAEAYTRSMAQRFADKAKAQLANLPNSTAKQCLLAVADYSISRVL